jgi:glycosyltransferase involved in cell wall biosynthesis
MGKPVVASRLPLVAETFGDAVATYEPGSASGLATALLRIADRPDARAALVAGAAERVRDLSWANEARRYIALVERLAIDGSGRPGRVFSAP